jgi:hypothetical protein
VPPSSALLASSAPPSSFERPRGLPRQPSRRTGVPRVLSWSSAPLRSVPRRLRPLPSPTVLACARPRRSRGGPPLLGFLLPRTPLRRVPLFTEGSSESRHGGRGSPDPRRCRPQGSCPSRRFRPHTRHARDPCGPRRSPWCPDASRPYSVPLASLERPCRAFPSRGAVPALAGHLLPCEFVNRLPPAQSRQVFHDRFPRRGDSLPTVHSEVNRNAGAETTVPYDR